MGFITKKRSNYLAKHSFALTLFILSVLFLPVILTVLGQRTLYRSGAQVTLDPVIVAAGDIACDIGKTCKDKATSDLIVQINPTAVLPLGDLQYETGSYSAFLNKYDVSWGRAKTTSFPVVGNHEYGTAGAGGYFDYWNGIGNQSGQGGDRSKGYYSYDIGNWHLIALNSNCSSIGGCKVGTAQETWLRTDLAANPGKCLLLYEHHPLYTSSTNISSSVKPLWQDFYNAHGDVILAGHAHYYERFALQDANGVADPTNGYREMIAGTGGKSHASFGTILATSEVRDNTSYGVLKVTLHQNSYDWQFVPISGSTFTDSGSGTCHNVTVAPTNTPTPTPTTDPNITPTDTPTPTPTMPPTPTPMPSPVTITLNTVADTYVRSDQATTNFGTATSMYSDGSPIKVSYFKFDLSSLAGKTVLSAKLRLKVGGDASIGTQSVDIVNDTSWSETIMTYNNRPALSDVLGSIGSSNVAYSWLELDFTSTVQSNIGQLVSFGIDETNSDGIDFYTKESSASNRPVLVIQTQ